MKSNLKKGIVYVFIANFINLIISLFSGFVLPKFLNIETYASIKLFQLYISYIGLVSFGFADGMYLRLGGKELEKLDKEELLSELKTFKCFQYIVALVCIIVAAMLKNEILFFCSLVIVPINVSGYLRNFYNAVGMFEKYSKYTNFNTLMIFVINCILVFCIKTNYHVIFILSYIIVYFIYWFIIENETIKIIGRKTVCFNISYLINDIKTGIMLLLGNFCNVIFTGIDRLFVQNFLGNIKFAYYSFAVSVENLLNIFIAPISTVMYNYFCNNQEEEKILLIKKYILIFSTLLITVFYPVKFVIDLWLDKYLESLSVLAILFSAQLFSIMIKCVHVNLYKATKSQKKYSIIMGSVIVLAIVLNVILFKLFGNSQAIAVATLIVNIIWFIIGEIDFKKYNLNIKDYIYMCCILILFLSCCTFSNVIYACLLYIIITAVLLLIFEKDEIIYCFKRIYRYINKYIKGA